MAIAELPLQAPHAPQPSRAIAAVLDLMSGLQTISAIREIRYSFAGGALALWLLTNREDLDANARIFALDRAYRRSADHLPLELEILPLDQVDASALPEGHVLIAR